MGPSLPPHSQHSALLRLHSALNAARSRLHGLPDAGIGYSLVYPLWSYVWQGQFIIALTDSQSSRPQSWHS